MAVVVVILLLLVVKLRESLEVTSLVVKLQALLRTLKQVKFHSVCLREEDIPGASLNGRQPSQLHVVELKCWLKCRGATTAGKKADLVKRLE